MFEIYCHCRPLDRRAIPISKWTGINVSSPTIVEQELLKELAAGIRQGMPRTHSWDRFSVRNGDDDEILEMANSLIEH